MKTRTYKVKFSSIYTGTRAPRPIKVTVNATGRTQQQSVFDVIIKTVDEHNINDESFRVHPELIEETN